MAPVISTSVLTKRFGKRVAVDRLDLEVSSGTIFGFLGPNGAGKTTTIRMLLGLAKATSGKAHLLGKEVPREMADLAGRVGAVLEEPSFYASMSGHDNLRVLARMIGNREALTRIGPVLEKLGLAERSGDKVGGYSQGMRHRLALAAALIHDPELFILDEPATGLDPAGIREVRDLLVDLRNKGKTVFFSSHFLSEVERICDQVAILKRGKVVAGGTLASLAPERESIRVVVGDAERAYTALQSKGWSVEREGNVLTVRDVAAEEVGSMLVSAGTPPKELSVTRRSLEDVFLGLTGEADV